MAVRSMESDLTDQRIAENNAIFRDANDKLEGYAREFGVTELIPFFCECANVDCREIIQLSAREYSDVRSHPARFLTVTGHEDVEGSSIRVVSRHGRYLMLEKTGRAAERAAELYCAGTHPAASDTDPRS